MDSTTSASHTRSIWRGLTALLMLVCVGCANQVVVEGNFPAPVLDKIPLAVGVYYDPEFRNHEFFDEAKSRAETDWIVRTGQAQVEMYNTLLPGMFDKVVLLNDIPEKTRVQQALEQGIDAVLVPHVAELQYSIPTQTKVNVFEIWMRYRYELYSKEGELVAEWTMTSYGKTPTAFLQTAEAAVNLAAVVALRDAGANFAMNFAQVPDVRTWMEGLAETDMPPAMTTQETEETL
ncbi:MAG: hypothetical protein AAGI24_08215 [Pseudomonadota bacterium]